MLKEISIKNFDPIEYAQSKIKNPYLKAYWAATARPKPADIKDDLGLAGKKHVYIQRILNLALPAYVITYDSRYPNVPISTSKMKALKTSKLRRGRMVSGTPSILLAQLSIPRPLDSMERSSLGGNCLIFIRDICGESFAKTN